MVVLSQLSCSEVFGCSSVESSQEVRKCQDQREREKNLLASVKSDLLLIYLLKIYRHLVRSRIHAGTKAPEQEREKYVAESFRRNS